MPYFHSRTIFCWTSIFPTVCFFNRPEMGQTPELSHATPADRIFTDQTRDLCRLAELVSIERRELSAKYIVTEDAASPLTSPFPTQKPRNNHFSGNVPTPSPQDAPHASLVEEGSVVRRILGCRWHSPCLSIFQRGDYGTVGSVLLKNHGQICPPLELIRESERSCENECLVVSMVLNIFAL